MYLLKLSLRPWKVAPLSQIFSAIAVGTLILLLGFLLWMQSGLRPLLSRLQGQQVITAYLKPSVDHNEEGQVVEKIRNRIKSEGQGAESIEVEFTGVHEFIKLIEKENPSLAYELKNLNQDILAIIPRYISVSGLVSSSMVEKVKSVSGIESAEISKGTNRSVIGAFSTFRWLLRILVSAIILALLAGLIHLSRMNAYIYKETLILLKFWGAGKISLATPEILSGLVVGVLGGIIAACGWIVIGPRLMHHVKTVSVVGFVTTTSGKRISGID